MHCGMDKYRKQDNVWKITFDLPKSVSKNGIAMQNIVLFSAIYLCTQVNFQIQLQLSQLPNVSFCQNRKIIGSCCGASNFFNQSWGAWMIRPDLVEDKVIQFWLLVSGIPASSLVVPWTLLIRTEQCLWLSNVPITICSYVCSSWLSFFLGFYKH